MRVRKGGQFRERLYRLGTGPCKYSKIPMAVTKRKVNEIGCQDFWYES